MRASAAALVAVVALDHPAEGGRPEEACAALAARLGCADWSVAELCPDFCAREPERTKSAPAAATAELPLLFMDPSDIRDTWGHQQLVATPAVDVTSAVCNASRPCSLGHPGLAAPLQGGLMAPNPLRPAAGYEIFFSSKATAEEYDVANKLQEDPGAEPKSVYFTTTPDFNTFTKPIRVAALNNFSKPTKKSVGCIAKSMTRSDDGRKYVIMTICNDAGLRPMVASSPLGVLSFSAQRELPSFWDHDDNNLGYSNGQFVDLQIMFQNQTTPGWSSGLKYCDNVGLVHCA